MGQWRVSSVSFFVTQRRNQVKLTSSLRKIGGQLINPWVAATAMAGLLMAAPPT